MEKDYTATSFAFLSKDWPPSKPMPFLSLIYNTLKMSTEVSWDKLDSITLLVRIWLNTPSTTKI